MTSVDFLMGQHHKRADEPAKPKSPPPDKTTQESKTPTTTMTDSGITHTIPNENQVTVTMHTTITQGIPTTSSTPPTNATNPASPTDSSYSALPTSSAAAPQPDNDSQSGISSGAVVGIAISGAAVLVALCVLFFVWRRRRARNGTQYSSDSTRQEMRASQEDALGEKDYPWPWHLSNTRRASEQAGRLGRSNVGDPFGPFGGRADKPYDVCRPPSNAFEMDGVDTAVTELPAAVPEPTPQLPNTDQENTATESNKVHCSSKDPRATLSNLRNEDGRPTYVNQWNQYIALAAQKEAMPKPAGL